MAGFGRKASCIAGGKASGGVPKMRNPAPAADRARVPASNDRRGSSRRSAHPQGRAPRSPPCSCLRLGLECIEGRVPRVVRGAVTRQVQRDQPEALAERPVELPSKRRATTRNCRAEARPPAPAPSIRAPRCGRSAFRSCASSSTFPPPVADQPSRRRVRMGRRKAGVETGPTGALIRLYPAFSSFISTGYSANPSLPNESFPGWKHLLSLSTVGPQQIEEAHLDECKVCSIDANDDEPDEEFDLPDLARGGAEDWQETTLKRLEAWIEERERMIAEVERRIAQEVAVV